MTTNQPCPVERDLDRHLKEEWNEERIAAMTAEKAAATTEKITALIDQIRNRGWRIDAATLTRDLGHAEGSYPDLLMVLEDAQEFLASLDATDAEAVA
jgi:formate-dependent nitrite reductase cytochrome c552 subunit